MTVGIGLAAAWLGTKAIDDSLPHSFCCSVAGQCLLSPTYTQQPHLAFVQCDFCTKPYGGTFPVVSPGYRLSPHASKPVSDEHILHLVAWLHAMAYPALILLSFTVMSISMASGYS